MRRLSICLALVVGVLTLAFSVGAQAPDPYVGIWKLDLAKSTFTPGPPPKSNTLKIEPVTGGALKQTFDGVNADGKTTHSEHVGKFDGSESPVQAVLPAVTTVTTNTLRQIDDHSFEVVNKTDGKVTTTILVMVSGDGKTMSGTVTGKNAQGQTVNTVAVWAKQ